MKVTELDRRVECTLHRTAVARGIEVTAPIGCTADLATWARLRYIVVNDPYVQADVRAHLPAFRKRCRDAGRTCKPPTVAELYK